MTSFLLCIPLEMWYKVPESTKVRHSERMSVTRAKPSSYHLKNWEVRYLLFLFLIAFAIRLVFLVEVIDSPLFFINFLKGSDMAKYISWGFSISSGDWLGSEAYWRAPLFPYMLGAMFKLYGENIYLACVIQAILSASTCVLIYVIAREAFDKKVACVSSLISCFYGPFIFHSAVLLSETLGIFLISLALFVFLQSLKKPGKGGFLISGALLGLASLARPNFLVLTPFILFVLVLRRKSLKTAALFLTFCAGLALMILPVTARNYIVSGRPVLISANAFETYRLANSYDSVVLNYIHPKLPMMPVLSLAFWKHQLKKAIFFWWGYEVPQNVNYYLFMKYSNVLNLPLFPFWLIGPLSLMGVLVSIIERRGNLVLYLFSLSYYISIVIFYIASRLRLPIMVGLIPFAGFCLCNFYRQLKLRTYRKFAPSFILFVGLVLLTIPWRVDRIRPIDYNNLRLAMLRKAMLSNKADQLKEFLEHTPEGTDCDTGEPGGDVAIPESFPDTGGL